MDQKDNITPVEVFSGSLWQAEIVKTMLENEGIEAFLGNEYRGTNSPWLTVTPGLNLVQVMVSSVDYDNARIVVSEYEKTQES